MAGILTTGNLLQVLGVPLALGGQWPEHSDRERDFRVILTHDVWQRSFGGRPDVIGKTITLDHAPGYVIQGGFSVIPLLEPLAYGMAVLALGGVVMVAS